MVANAQDLSNLRGRTPVKVTGSIGTNNTFYHSSNPFQMRSPMANTLFANLNFDVYGMQIPFSFYMSNDSRDFSHPFARFGMSPRYKNLQVHLGYRSMNFSPYTYNNLLFLGVGVEFRWRLLRTAVFTGSLNQAQAPKDNQITSGSPLSYHRQAYGLKLGVGNTNNYFDVIIFNARDDTLSINPVLGQHLQPKENLILGTSFRFNLWQRVSVSSNFAASAYNSNMRSTEIEIKEMNWMSDFYTPRFGSVVRLAGDIRTNFQLGRVNTMLLYRLIQPEFQSLGTTYQTNNIQQGGLSLNTTLWQNRVATTVAFYYQEDNVTKTQLYTNTGLVMTLNAMVRATERLTITGNYNGYDQRQKDGTAMVNDTTRINRIMHNITFSPTYSFDDASKNNHTITSNVNLSLNSNQNKLISDPSDITTWSSSLGYHINLDQNDINLMANLSYQQSSSQHYSFNATSLSLGAGKRFLQEKNLNVQVNSSLSFSEVSESTRNISVMTGLTTSYTFLKNHTANFRFTYNHMNNFHVDGLYSMNGYDTTVSVGYTYRFTPFSGRNNTENQQRQ